MQLADIKAGPDRLLLGREIEAARQAAMMHIRGTQQELHKLLREEFERSEAKPGFDWAVKPGLD